MNTHPTNPAPSTTGQFGREFAIPATPADVIVRREPKTPPINTDGFAVFYGVQL